MKKKILQFHFFLFLFLILQWIFSELTGFSLKQNIIFGIKILVFISGFILLIYFLKPFKKISLYFLYYLITPLISFLGYLFGGVFLVGILMSILLFPILPKDKKFENKDFVIYTKFEGMMGSCCNYEIKKKFFIFEKKIDDVNFEELNVNFDKLEVYYKNNLIIIEYFFPSYEDEKVIKNIKKRIVISE